MAATKLTVCVQKSPLEEHAVLLGEAIVKKWKIPVNDPVTLRFGSFKKKVWIVSAKTPKMRLQPAFAAELGLPRETALHLSYKSGSRTLEIGPLIGVLLSGIHSVPARPFGKMTAFCREMTQACESKGAFLYFFSPSELGYELTAAINGWSYSGGWSKSEHPVPDVIYNRLTTRKAENSTKVQQFFKEAKSRYGARVFNEKYLDKTEVFRALREEPSLHRYLPESHSLNDPSVLKRMARKHDVLFLKPVTGSLGKGIIRMVRRPDGSWLCQFNNPVGVRTQTYSSESALLASVRARLRKSRYQVQQGLELMDIGGRPVDFRALVQRNKEGEWSVTSVVARTAAAQSFVSNLARGGTLSPVREAVARSNLPGDRRTALPAKLQKAALDIAGGICARIPAHFAELGVDLAVDAEGKIWLLEVNSKPSKDENSSLREDRIRPSVRKLVDYTLYLAGS